MYIKTVVRAIPLTTVLILLAMLLFLSLNTGVAISARSEEAVKSGENDAKPSVSPEQVEKTKTAKVCSQIITVTTKSLKDYKANINVFEKTDGKWKHLYKDLQGVTGKNGIMYNRKQNTGTSPAGVYTITKGFGIASNPGVKFPYRKVQDDDYWVTDPKSKFYNTWQKGPSNGRWDEKEQEHLIKFKTYKYCAIIDFNVERIPYKGAGIFLHLPPSGGRGTQGCIGMKESDLLKVLKWITPKKGTRIIICPKDDIEKF